MVKKLKLSLGSGITKLLAQSGGGENDISKVRLINILAITGITFFAGFGLIVIYFGNWFIGVYELAMIAVFILALILSQVKKTEGASSIAVLGVFIMAIAILISGGYNNTGLFWMFTFPIVAFSLKGSNKGAVWMVLLFWAFALIDILDSEGIINLPYSNFTLRIFRITLIIVAMLTFIYQKTQEIVLRAIVKQKRKVEKANKHIKHEKNKFNTILQSIGDGVFVLDSRRKIILVNKMTESLSGYTVDELVGDVYYKKLRFINENDHKEYTGFIDNVYKKGRITSMDKNTVLIKKDGTELPVDDSAAPLLGEKGDVIGCVVVFRDFTKQREIDKMKTEFVSVASHQLKTPLASIQWTIDMLNDPETGKLSAKQKSFMHDIIYSTKKMVSLVDDLLNVSRIETGRKFTIETTKQDIIPHLQEVIRDETMQAKMKNIKIVVDKSMPKKMEIPIDAMKIKQVFHNLINNAVKYSEEGSQVEVGYEQKGYHDAVFYVRDHGMGIPEDQKKRLFEKFFRAENVKEKKIEGTGLGLYIVKTIVEGHSGSVMFVSKVGKGTTFYVSLPKDNK